MIPLEWATGAVAPHAPALTTGQEYAPSDPTGADRGDSDP